MHQYSCLENPVDRGAWLSAIHSIEESDMTEQLRVHARTRVIMLQYLSKEVGKTSHIYSGLSPCLDF